MANLYEINQAINELLEGDYDRNDEVVDGETGLITTTENMLDELELDLKTKLDNIACYIKNLDADIEAIRNEEKTLAERRRVKENQAQRLRDYLSFGLQQAGYDKFESARCVLSFRKSKQVIIDPDAELPEQFITIETIEKPNKKALKEALEEGALIEGARIVENRNLQIK